MSEIKRLRMFAGPNGSGKSTLFESFKENFDPGVYINSDLIEKEISENGFINLEKYKLELVQNDLDEFYESGHAKTLLKKSKDIGHVIDIQIKENILVDKSKDTHSYEASFITSFLREKLFESNKSFSFETVMSHFSKIDEIRKAKMLGYKTYLYFICLDDPELNISRVHDRVEKGGHDVDPDKIVSRYSRTLENLLPAIKSADKSYLFDNSDVMTLIATSENEQITILVEEKNFPNWFINYIVNIQ